jgi:hypothetical protein
MDMHRVFLIMFSLLIVLGAVCSLAQASGAALLFSDDFELGPGN